MNYLVEKRVKQVDKLIFFLKDKSSFSERKHYQIYCVTTADVGLYNFWDSYIACYLGL